MSSNLRDPIQTELVKARVRLLFDYPFFGNLVTRLDLVDATKWCQTAATDGRRFYYNREFIKKLSREELLFLFGHEILHCVYDHIGRRGNRDPQIWNMAVDYVVNSTLKRERVGEMIKGGLISDKYTDEMSSDEIYNLLQQNSVQVQVPLDEHLDLSGQSQQSTCQECDGSGEVDEDQQGGSGDEDDQDGQSGQDGDDGQDGQDGDQQGKGKCQQDSDGDDDGEGDGDGQGDSNKQGQGKGHGQGGKKPCPSCGGSGKQQGSGSGQGGGSGKTATVTVIGEDGPPQLSEDDLDQIRNEMKAALINAARTVGAGKVPAGIKRLIEDLTEPKMDWRTMLECHIQSSIKDDYTWRRPSKKTWACGAIIPGQNFMDTVDIAVAIDCSGSISDTMLKDFLSEVKGIMDTFKEFKLRLWSFDTRVYNEAVYTQENSDELLEYDIQGGGGTDFVCNWTHMRENDIEPHKFVMFTDGYPWDSWGEEDYCDTLFIIHGNDKIEAPFGQTAHYDDEDNRN